jgi:hypothetical protein
MTDATPNMTPAQQRAAERVRELVAAAPELSPLQLAKLRRLFSPYVERWYADHEVDTTPKPSRRRSRRAS